MTTDLGLGPTADGSPLELSVDCRTDRRASRGKQHPIRINADWSVATPHDLAAERVARALGGFTSCLELVDEVIPALAASMGLLSRREHAPLEWRSDRGSWRVKGVRGCRCVGAKFTSAQRAAEHLRSAEHLSRRFRVGLRPFREVVQAVQAASDTLSFSEMLEAAGPVDRLVLEIGGVKDLWLAGIHPADIPRLASYAHGVSEPLPASYYIGMRYAGADPAWLARTIRHRPDPQIAAWLAWAPAQPTLVRDDIGVWLGMGLGRRDIEALTSSLVTPLMVRGLAAETGWSDRHTARAVAAWAAADCLPEAEHLQLLDRHGLGSHFRPSRSAIDKLERIAELNGWCPGRSELAAMVALAGSAHNVEVALSGGVRSATELDRWLAWRDEPR